MPHAMCSPCVATHATVSMRADTQSPRYCPRLVQFHGFRSVKVLKFDTPSASPKNCPEAKEDYVRVQISPSRPVSFFMIKPRFFPSRDQFNPV
ncbi:hypothetical protein YC2023_098265 [Brassica napus]